MVKKTFSDNYTRNILLQMAMVLLVLFLVAFWQWELVYQIYIENQISGVGWVINGGILTLFVCGLVQLIKRFFGYRGEERAINRFLRNVELADDPLLGVPNNSVIAKRYVTVRDLSKSGSNINQNALAATLMATESSRNSFLKFVHNVLILTGVFGTIVSLSIALMGASDMLQGTSQTSGLGMMIFGMSTALSTTMTAIIVYLFFGFFYIKLTDTQTYLISRVEEITATTLIPRMQAQKETLVMDVTENVKQATELVRRFDQTQALYAESARTLQAATQSLEEKLKRDDGRFEEEMIVLLGRLNAGQKEANEENRKLMQHMIQLLQKGFRLGDGS